MSACQKIKTRVSLDEAHGILIGFFEVARDDFVRAGFKLVKQVQFYVAPEIHDSPRHFAACATTGKKILCAPELVELPAPYVVGILYHECGHAVDFLYPGEFALGRGGVMRRRREGETEGQWLRWQRTWNDRDDDVVEQTADGIAEIVKGEPIGYAGACKLQNFRTGEARPQGLR